MYFILKRIPSSILAVMSQKRLFDIEHEHCKLIIYMCGFLSSMKNPYALSNGHWAIVSIA